MTLKEMFKEGHLEDDKHQLGILIASVEYEVVRYRGTTYWSVVELMEEKEIQNENINRWS